MCLRRREIIFKAGEAYGLDLFAATRREDLPEDWAARAQAPEVEAPILVRRADGTVTAINGVGCAPALSAHPLPADGAQVAERSA